LSLNVKDGATVRYLVTLNTDLTFTTEVEADSEDEAYEAAREEAPGLCHQCAQMDMGDFENYSCHPL
jgi:hypothetical protein